MLVHFTQMTLQEVVAVVVAVEPAADVTVWDSWRASWDV